MGLRARFLLLAMGASSLSNQQNWVARAEAEQKKLEGLKVRREQGLIGKSEVTEAEIKPEDYGKGMHPLLQQRLDLIEARSKMGLPAAEYLLQARIQLAFLKRRLGEKADEEIRTLQLQAEDHFQGLVKTGRLGSSEYLSRLVNVLTDPDEDMDR